MFPLDLASDAVGVGRRPFAAIENSDNVPALGRSFSPPTPLMPFWLDLYVEAVGVGSRCEKEKPLSEVRRADLGRAKTVPLCMPPAAGKR